MNNRTPKNFSPSQEFGCWPPPEKTAPSAAAWQGARVSAVSPTGNARKPDWGGAGPHRARPHPPARRAAKTGHAPRIQAAAPPASMTGGNRRERNPPPGTRFHLVAETPCRRTDGRESRRHRAPPPAPVAGAPRSAPDAPPRSARSRRAPRTSPARAAEICRRSRWRRRRRDRARSRNQGSGSPCGRQRLRGRCAADASGNPSRQGGKPLAGAGGSDWLRRRWCSEAP